MNSSQNFDNMDSLKNIVKLQDQSISSKTVNTLTDLSSIFILNKISTNFKWYDEWKSTSKWKIIRHSKCCYDCPNQFVFIEKKFINFEKFSYKLI